MKVARQEKSKALIPTASMADIAFLLIIFFMVTTVYEVDRTRVNLPFSVEYTEAEKGAAIVVLSQQDGNLVYRFSDGEEMSTIVPGPREIYMASSALAYRDPTIQILIKADGELRFALIDELMDQLRRAGVQKLLLLTQPAGGE